MAETRCVEHLRCLRQPIFDQKPVMVCCAVQVARNRLEPITQSDLHMLVEKYGLNTLTFMHVKYNNTPSLPSGYWISWLKMIKNAAVARCVVCRLMSSFFGKTLVQPIGYQLYVLLTCSCWYPSNTFAFGLTGAFKPRVNGLSLSLSPRWSKTKFLCEISFQNETLHLKKRFAKFPFQNSPNPRCF